MPESSTIIIPVYLEGTDTAAHTDRRTNSQVRRNVHTEPKPLSRAETETTIVQGGWDPLNAVFKHHRELLPQETSSPGLGKPHKWEIPLLEQENLLTYDRSTR